jgi:hypothetical protein
MEDKKREILNQVAAGTISAVDGAARLEALSSGAEAASGTGTATLAAPAPSASDTKFVKVMSVLGTAEIVGDPSVAFAVADGPHKARQEGDAMIIEHTPFDEHQTFYFGHGDRRAVVGGLDFSGKRHLTVRMNPDLPLIANVQAGNVRIVGVRGPIKAEVQAGNCKVADFVSPLNLVVQAGNVTASGCLDSGDSKIRCEMGSVKLNLEEGSSVRITARSTMGQVVVEGDAGRRVIAGRGGRDVTIGGGAATLDIECTMGSVKLSAD